MWTPSVLVATLWAVWQTIAPWHESKTYVPATLRPALWREHAQPSYRLPATVQPVHYDLTLFSDVTELRFQGAVNITLEVLHDTHILEFNAGRNLNLSDVHVVAPSHTYTLPPAIDTKRERVRVTLPSAVRQGDVVYLALGYTSQMDQSMRGYYYSSWEHKQQAGHYALTQFEPTSARRAYPGWDEPSYKATFAFRMLHRNDTVALANMPSVHAHTISARDAAQLLHTSTLRMPTPHLGDDVWAVTAFAETPRMAPYLVAWANGAFQHVSGSTHSPLRHRTIPLRMFTSPEFIHQADFAVEAMARVLPEYEKVFDIAYPLPKLDALVAADFDFGAMENWGLITGRNSVFMYDKKAGLQGKKNAAGVMSHEIAHMWFGNMATLAWWDSLWLNEAFATLMGEMIILDRVFPEWQSEREFIVTHLMRALDLDAKRSSHRIEIPLSGDNVEDEVTQSFDGISYSKGASVLRMLSHMLGQDVFLHGVSLYLKDHLYGSTVTKDLWEGISQASHLNVSAIMSEWVQTQGFPVICVTEKDDALHVQQHRFLETGDASADEDATLWYVPLGLQVFDAPTPQAPAVLAHERSKAIALPHASQRLWKLNAGTTGVFRVAYPPHHLAKLAKAAAQAESPISVEDRIGLVSDACALAQAGYTPTSSALTLLHTLRGDRSALVHRAASLGLTRLASAWWEQPTSVQQGIAAFRQAMFGPMARSLTLEYDENDTLDVRELRTTVVTAAAAAGDSWTIREIQRRFAPLRDDDDDSWIPPDLLRTILTEGVKHGGEKEYNTALRIYHHPPTPAHKTAALMALGSTQVPSLIERTLAMVFSGGVKAQDFSYVYSALSSNVKSRRALWEATKMHFDTLMRLFDGNFSFVDVIKSAIAGLTSEEDYEDVLRFFHDKDTSQYSQSLAQSLESIQAQRRWLQRDAEDVQQWLHMHEFL